MKQQQNETEGPTQSKETSDLPSGNHSSINKTADEKRNRADRLTTKDLKGKQVDADPTTDEGKPLDNQ